ncbi:DUF3093 domain-containing protein [Microbacterium sp. VKM Ac-2870]|uniref:DUF3093 domain-containing protein n=1 Tax=Microbacterium sp. VKM Ac-2870 TaxID=2783825 RepID=UPI00188B7092|nr:DUF3093 domain-containing protein [Microbacterium sp. VKM Ac-2870]MBF4560884.1 DUF3093 domain-containing protein [Microbacterium sp. VKM Ac-2870]
MHIAATTAPASDVVYRERLSPSLWTLLSAAVLAPMVALVFVPLDPTIALATGVAVAAALIALLVFSSPVVEVRDGELRVGRAHIPVDELGDAEPLWAEDARAARGPGLSRTSWHMLRGGIDPVVRVAITDPGDPVTDWVFATRTPDRVIAAIRRAQSR